MSNLKDLKKLTIQEEEAMQLIWKNKGGFIKELLDSIEGEKPPYTTLASTVKKLEQMGYVKGVKYANAKRYEALIDQETYTQNYMSGFVSDYFKNSYKEMVSFFAKEEKISQEDLEEILNMINKED